MPLDSKSLHDIEREQQAICTRFHLKWLATPPEQTIVISTGVKEGVAPVYGMHQRPVKASDSGWILVSHGTPRAKDGSPDGEYLHWAHARHIYETRPVIARYLGLPLGWRFIAKDVGEPYEDVWEDASLLVEETSNSPSNE